jgi:hypothetical protein
MSEGQGSTYHNFDICMKLKLKILKVLPVQNSTVSVVKSQYILFGLFTRKIKTRLRKNIHIEIMILNFKLLNDCHVYCSTLMHVFRKVWRDTKEVIRSHESKKNILCNDQNKRDKKTDNGLTWSHHFESFTVTAMIWLTVMEYTCHKWPPICSTCRSHFPVLSSFMTYHRVCN